MELDCELREASDASSSYNIVRNYDASKDDTINESLQTLPFFQKLWRSLLVRDFSLLMMLIKIIIFYCNALSVLYYIKLYKIHLIIFYISYNNYILAIYYIQSFLISLFNVIIALYLYYYISVFELYFMFLKNCLIFLNLSHKIIFL